MGKTLEELFKGSPQDKAVKPAKETLVEQETTGIRVKSAVELNNPGIYGNEATRIVTRSTPDLEKMKKGTGGEAGDGGLIGKGLSKLGVDGGIGGLRDKVNTKLGIPVNQIPTRVIEQIKGQDTQTPVVTGENGTEVGKLLKESGGNPKTIIKQGAGKLIGKAKDKLRGALFGEPNALGNATPEEEAVRYTTNVKGETYSDQKDGYKDSNITKEDLEGTKLDLKLVSPLYGVVRKDNDGKFGKGPYAFINNKFPNSKQSFYTPESKDTAYNQLKRETIMNSEYGLDGGDSINMLSPSDDYTLDDDGSFAKVGDKTLKDFIPVWFKKYGTSKPTMFRALISGLTETVSPSWNTSKFVGNPYNFYSFDNIERSTSFNLKMYCNNPIELAVNWEKITKITQMTYPSVGAQYANSPILQFRIGDIYNGKIGFIESLTYTIPDESNWETDGNVGYLPKIIDIAITIKFIEWVGMEDRPYDYTISKTAAEAINKKRQSNADIADSRTNSDGSIKQDDPVKVTPKKVKQIEVKIPKIKLPKAFGSSKKTSTPSDVESAKLPDNANQGGVSDKLDGKTPSAFIKEAQSSGIPPKMAAQIASLKNMGYEETSKSTIPSNQTKFIRDTSAQSKFFKRSQFGKWDIYQVTADFGIPRRVAGGIGTI